MRQLNQSGMQRKCAHHERFFAQKRHEGEKPDYSHKNTNNAITFCPECQEKKERKQEMRAHDMPQFCGL